MNIQLTCKRGPPHPPASLKQGNLDDFTMILSANGGSPRGAVDADDLV
jgi:hypothetical protein